MELKNKMIEGIMEELNKRNEKGILNCFERILEEMPLSKLKSILEDLEEERTC